MVKVGFKTTLGLIFETEHMSQTSKKIRKIRRKINRLIKWYQDVFEVDFRSESQLKCEQKIKAYIFDITNPYVHDYWPVSANNVQDWIAGHSPELFGQFWNHRGSTNHEEQIQFG